MLMNFLTHCPLNAPTRVTPDSDSLSTPERRHWQTCVYPGSHIAVKKKNTMSIAVETCPF